MTAALEGGEWSAARPGRTLPSGKTRYPFYRRLGGPQGRPGRVENLVPTEIRSRTIQTVVSRYIDWATRPTLILCNCEVKSISTKIVRQLTNWCGQVPHHLQGSGRGSVFGTATRHRLDGRRGRDFPHPSGPSLEPAQPPLQWVRGIPGRKAAGACRSQPINI